MPEYLVMIEVRKVYEMYVTAPDDTAIFEHKEKPYRLSADNLARIEDVEFIGELIESSKEIVELIEGV